MTDDIINLDEVYAKHEFVIDGETVALAQFDSHPVEGGVLTFLPKPFVGIYLKDTGSDLKEKPEQTPEEKLESAVWLAMHLGEEADRLVAARAHLRAALVGPIRQEPIEHPLYTAITERLREVRAQIRDIEF